MELYRQALVENAGRIAIVAVTWVSNVTGAVLPVEAITAMAKQAGAVTVVDAAQAVPHLPLQMTPDMDFVAFSGHKLYSPGSPGVLIGPCSAFQGLPVGDVGGGAVESVNSGGTHWKTRVEEREEAGTPNVPGVVSLGTMATMLQRVGMGAVRRHDEAATEALLTRLHAVPQCIVYGSDRPGGVSRAGVVSFNLAHVPHAVVARILDERGVAVRNACFCAHPYVRRTLSEQPLPESSLREEFPDRPGMVRASVGPWTTVEDLDKLAAALTWVSAHPAEAAALYRVAQDVQCFDLDTAAEEALR